MNVTVLLNIASILGVFKPFWESTGFCPPDPHQDVHKYLLSNDMKQNLALFSAIPSQEMKQVRIHWLMDMICSKDFGKSEFDFHQLDEFIRILHKYRLKPGFELMGNPSDQFTDFENVTEVHIWKDLVKQLAKRYINKYGIEYVSSWNFETWNEPNNHDFDNLNFTQKGFLNYIWGCSEGLQSASPLLKFGGPGDACHCLNTSRKGRCFCYTMFNHSVFKNTSVSLKHPILLDYITIHRKGDGKALNILLGELKTMETIRNLFPQLRSIPYMNNEADPLVGWSKAEEWRADSTYAAIVVKVISQHAHYMLSQPFSPRIMLLSNDNGFLSYSPHYFTQRTLLARFQMNNTHPQYVQFIKKPVYVAMGLLSRLGGVMLKDEVKIETVDDERMKDITWRTQAGMKEAACQKEMIAVLLYNSCDTENVTGSIDVNVKIDLGRYYSHGQELLWMLFIEDNFKTNPYQVWKSCGSPSFPNSFCFRKMRKAEGPAMPYDPQRVTTPSWNISLHLALPGVALIHICSKVPLPYEVYMKTLQIEQVHFIQVSANNLLIIWNAASNKCLLTYEVEFSVDAMKYKQINEDHVIFSSFLFAVEDFTESRNNCTICGYYRIRAVDFWLQKGPYSHPRKFRK